MTVLNSVESLLNHIKAVQEDVIELSNDSFVKIGSYIEKNKLEVDDDIATAIQYQDIITQQLSATIEAIESVKANISRFTHAYENDENLVKESMNKLEDKLNAVLEDAKEKKSRFSGKTAKDNSEIDEIEFF